MDEAGCPPASSLLDVCSSTNIHTLHGQISTWVWVHLSMATIDDPSTRLPRSLHFSLLSGSLCSWDHWDTFLGPGTWFIGAGVESSIASQGLSTEFLSTVSSSHRTMGVMVSRQ